MPNKVDICTAHVRIIFLCQIKLTFVLLFKRSWVVKNTYCLVGGTRGGLFAKLDKYALGKVISGWVFLAVRLFSGYRFKNL